MEIMMLQLIGMMMTGKDIISNLSGEGAKVSCALCMRGFVILLNNQFPGSCNSY